jgi:hypothetical protein
VGGLAETDRYGMAAYLCAADQRPLGPVPEAPGVLRCPQCGHRTDAPGEGTLADGFDIVHRQWGLRGDPHAWHAMRELVAGTATPPARDAARAAYVDALRQVADVDIDHTDEQVVYRAQLDHGGMSGGGVNVDWWRTKGIPLLVDRATARRPPDRTSGAANGVEPPEPRRRSLRRMTGDIVVWALILAIPAALLGGGGFLLYQRAAGTRVEATVLRCDSTGGMVRGASTYRTECIAEWTIDGRTVVGGFSGGNGTSDVGKTVDATVRNGTAYSRSLGLPILLIALGVPFLLPPLLAVRRRLRGRA